MVRRKASLFDKGESLSLRQETMWKIAVGLMCEVRSKRWAWNGRNGAFSLFQTQEAEKLEAEAKLGTLFHIREQQGGSDEPLK